VTISEKDLFLAILSMDSYNRGYNSGMSDRDGDLGRVGSSLGTAAA
jgi:hypothetical protein